MFKYLTKFALLKFLLDEIIIYNKALNETEIQEIYCGQGGVGAFCTLLKK